MTKRSLAYLSLIGAAILASASAPARADDLTAVNYGGAINEWSHIALWEPFTKATGTKVIEDSRDYGIGIVRTKVQGGANTWDVVAAEDIEVIQGCEEGLLQKIDWSKIHGKDQFLPQAVLPCAQGEIIYDMNIVYDGNRIKGDGPKNWADFWNVQKWPGKRVLYNDPRDSLEAALMADGVPRGDVYKVLGTPAGIDRAFHKLDELKPNLLWWNNPGQSRQMLISGDAAIAATYGGGTLMLNRKEHTNFKVEFTDSIVHIDYWAIVKGTPHLATAMKFLDFASGAEPQAKFASLGVAGVPNREAGPLLEKIDATLPANLPSSPDHLKVSLLSDPPFWLEHYDALNQRFTAWRAQ